MGRNHKNRIVFDVDPAYASEDWQPKTFRAPTYTVAAYTRVSENNDDHEYGLNVRKNYYEIAISAQPTWKFVGLYADEGLVGASARNRKEFDRMITDCRAGKIDLIIVKNFSCLANSFVSSLKKIETLLAMDPQVGIYIEENGINTLTAVGRKTLLDMINVRQVWKAG